MIFRRRGDALLQPGGDRGVADTPHKLQLALVLWDGELGGTEVMYAGLASSMRRLGAAVELVFVTHSGPLADLLSDLGVPFRVLGLPLGRDVLRQPRAFAQAMHSSGPDGVILPERGFIGAALRWGGYRAPIVAVEHGALLLTGLTWRGKLRRGLNTLAGAWADDLEVGVSDFMVARMRRAPHARRLHRIYNGIDPSRFTGLAQANNAAGTMVGLAARLIPGKGIDDAIAAVAAARDRTPLTLMIAGDGPERERLSSYADRLGLTDQVQFLGLVKDMPAFWQRCDVAIFPSHQFIESFGMAAVEAMACGKPVVATRNGAAPEVIADQFTGVLVQTGDVGALSDALVAYATRPELRRRHGEAGRERVVDHFHIDNCARAYLRCLVG